MLSLNWFAKSLLAMVLIIPFFIAVGFFNKNYNVKPELTVMLWNIGVVVGMYVWSMKVRLYGTMEFNTQTFVICVIILAAGISLGAIANILFAQALAESPNPGLPVAIVNAAAIPVFVISYFLFLLLPAYFNTTSFDPIKLIGVVLTIAGIWIISLK